MLVKIFMDYLLTYLLMKIFKMLIKLFIDFSSQMPKMEAKSILLKYLEIYKIGVKHI